MIKFLTEYCPIISFFITYKLYGIFNATMVMMVITIIALVASYYYEKKIHKTTLISAILLLFSSSLTLITGNTDFIKIKPTILYLLFGLSLYIGLLYKRIFLSTILGQSIKLDESDWIILSKRFSIFFFIMALLNEIIWRSFSENFWVNYKMFGTIILMFIFLITQSMFIQSRSQK